MKRVIGMQMILPVRDLLELLINKTAALPARFFSFSEEAFSVGTLKVVGETAGVAGPGGFF